MRRLLAALLFWLLPALALAQGSATLVADSLTVTAEGRLEAEGNVQAFYEGTSLSASALTYDRDADRIEITGPILIREAGGTILAADAASLDPQLRNGILRGARLVLDRRLQLAANSIERVDGRYSALTGAAVTSCQVCGLGPPLWDIQATRVVHDEEARQIYLDGARFRIRGVPVFWLPSLRLPDPTNTRAAGVLVPGFVASGRLGFGLRLPYFVPLGPSRDITISPFLAARSRTVELRFRQSFARGEVGLRGAVSRDDLDDLDPDVPDLRGFVLARGSIDVGAGTILGFDGLILSDEAYLSDHGLSDDDRFESSVTLTRVGERSLLEGDLIRYRSLREDEPDGSLPPIVARLDWGRRLTAFGGTLTLDIGADAFERTAPGDGDAARDMARLGVAAGWRRDRVLASGIVAEAETRVALDAYRIADDAGQPGGLVRAMPAAALTLRWPWLRPRPGGGDLIELVASLGWSAALGDRPPNEDSRLVEFDEANLHALSRLPGDDGEESGARLSYGVAWTRQAGGGSATLAVGRLVRTEAIEVSDASGLAGLASDTLVSARLATDQGLSLGARTLLGAGFEVGKTEARVGWAGRTVTASAAYLYLPADLDEARARTAAEWTVDAEWRASDRWSLSAGGRYDVGNSRPARARLGVVWRNECVEVDVSASRRYTSSDSQEPTTDFGLAIKLDGFSAGGRAPVAPASCRR